MERQYQGVSYYRGTSYFPCQDAFNFCLHRLKTILFNRDANSNSKNKVTLDSQTSDGLIFNGPFSITFHLWGLGSSCLGSSVAFLRCQL